MTASYVLTRHLDLARSFDDTSSQGAPGFDNSSVQSSKNARSVGFTISSTIQNLSQSAMILHRPISILMTDPTAVRSVPCMAIHLSYCVLRFDLAVFLNFLSGLSRTTT